MSRLAIVLTALALAAMPGVCGQGKGKGKDKAPNGNSQNPDAAQDHRFLPEERGVILGYYRSGNRLPPGLEKRGGDLPPGLEKQLRRNGRLPPGLEKHLAPFPRELELRLPAPPPNCRRVLLGTRAMLISDAASVVLDILDLTRGR